MSSAEKTIMISILLLLVVVSCTGGAEQATASVNPAEVLTPSIETQNTATVEALSAQTATPVFTNTPTMTLTSPIETHNQVTPTVQDENKWASIQDLMENNGYCKLPCLWGITPGVSKWDKAKEFLQSTGLSISDGYDIENNSTLYMILGLQVGIGEGILDNHMSFLIKDDIVEGIYFSSYAIETEVEFQDLLKNYSPDKILKDYGIPSNVLLESSSSGPSGPGRVAGYELWLFYDEIGFLIRYHGFSEFEPVYRICPGFHQEEGIYSIQLYMQSPSNLESIESMAEKFDLDIPAYPYIQTIEESVGITPQEFYELFIDDSQEACFDTPQEIWP